MHTTTGIGRRAYIVNQIWTSLTLLEILIYAEDWKTCFHFLKPVFKTAYVYNAAIVSLRYLYNGYILSSLTDRKQIPRQETSLAFLM